jgi:hypothetical protein
MTAGRATRDHVAVTLSGRIGAAVGGTVVLAGLAGAVLHAVNSAAVGPGEDRQFWLMTLVAAVAFGSGGGVLAAARPRMSLGWLLLLVGLSESVTLLGVEWGVYALRVRPDLPLGEPAYWLGTWTWVVGYTALVAIVPFVLPDGRLASRRWRPVLALAVTACGLESLGWALTPYERLDIQPSVAGAANPVASPQLSATLSAVGQPLLVVAIVLGVAAMVVRWRRSPSEQRTQLAWVLYGMGLTAALIVSSTAIGVSGPDAPWLSAVALVPLPAACVVAVLRHRLWNLDVVVSRSLLYGALPSSPCWLCRCTGDCSGW